MNIINLGILAHIDAGKTSVTENLLFASGATEKCGRVDNGDTITDSMDIEKRRGITVRASTTSIIWNGVYNRGIQMYRFPNSDVQKSVIFEGIKKRLKIV